MEQHPWLVYILTVSRTKRLKDSWQKFVKLIKEKKIKDNPKRKSSDIESQN